MSVRKSSAPLRAAATAVARPIPLAAPVTSVFFSFSDPITMIPFRLW